MRVSDSDVSSSEKEALILKIGDLLEPMQRRKPVGDLKEDENDERAAWGERRSKEGTLEWRNLMVMEECGSDMIRSIEEEEETEEAVAILAV